MDPAGIAQLSPTCQKVGDVGLTDYFRAAQKEIAERRALVAGKKERLVVEDGSADGAAILVALNRIRRSWCGEEVLCVEDRIAHKLKRVSVETVRTGLRDDVDDAAGILPVFRAVVAGLHAELLKRVGEREGLVDIGVLVHIVSAVEQVANGVLSRTIGRISHGAGEGLGGSLIRAAIRGINRAGDQKGECRSVAAVQGQFRDAFLFDDLPESRGGGIHLRFEARYCNHLGCGAQPQRNVHRQSLIREQGNAGLP